MNKIIGIYTEYSIAYKNALYSFLCYHNVQGFED